jgi:hypothetical protein
MPNHVSNRLIIQAEESRVKEITDMLMGEPEEDGSPCHMDFNKITPMPQELQIEESSYGGWGLAILQRKEHAGRPYSEIKKMFDELESKEKNKILKLGRQYRDNKKKYGHHSWYGWSIANWGTKWNAYNTKKTAAGEIWFDTAWACVYPLVRKLSKMFPDAVFDYTFADEDTGSNCGHIVIRNGGEEKRLIPEYGSKEAYEIAFEMWPGLEDMFLFDGNTYHYNEEEDDDA